MSLLIDPDKLKQILEAALMAADEPLTVDQLARLFAHGELDSEEGRAQLRDTLAVLESETAGRGYELVRVASGYRYQVRQELSEWVSRLWDEKPPRYTRALLETLALIVYKQPVTRGDIEQVRGVAVSQNIMRTLVERGWIRVVGQREVPGRPSLYGTTRAFLDYFALKSLDQLPPLAEIKALIEPLVIDEVIEEAREVAERDHPELAAMGETWQGARSDSGGGEPTEEASATSHDQRQNDQELGLEGAADDDRIGYEQNGLGQNGLGQNGHTEGGDAEAAEKDDLRVSDQVGEVTVGRVSVDEIRGEGADSEVPDRDAPSAEIVQLPIPPRR